MYHYTQSTNKILLIFLVKVCKSRSIQHNQETKVSSLFPASLLIRNAGSSSSLTKLGSRRVATPNQERKDSSLLPVSIFVRNAANFSRLGSEEVFSTIKKQKPLDCFPRVFWLEMRVVSSFTKLGSGKVATPNQERKVSSLLSMKVLVRNVSQVNLKTTPNQETIVSSRWGFGRKCE